jgi:phosphoglycolate phosphatase
MKNVIFDLDGTLIDSAPAILSCMNRALNEHDIYPIEKLGVDLIGPPLDLTLEKILGPANISLVPRVIESFKKIYDAGGFKISAPYVGIEKLLQSLKRANINSYIATNKRVEPTTKIIEYLRWGDYFSGIYGINTRNSTGEKFANKSEMIRHLLSNYHIEVDQSIYIGDRIEDQIAATNNNLESVTVNWGYGDYSEQSIYLRLIRNPADIFLLVGQNE